MTSAARVDEASSDTLPMQKLRRWIPRPTGSDTATYWVLAMVLAVLNLIGLIMVLSASSVVALEQEGSSWSEFQKQGMWMLLGFGALLVTLYVDLSAWRRFARPALFAVLGLLVVVLLPGVGATRYGATRWIDFGPVQVQPSELAKLGLLLFVSDLLARRIDRVRDVRFSVRPVLAVLALVGLLIMKQPNLGTTIIVASIVFGVLVAAGAPGRSLAGYGLLGAAAALALAFGSSYRRARMLSFLNPWADPTKDGYQLIQSQVGLASGGFFGVGLGQSRAKWGFLPFAHTDFIFAVIGEELGLIGAVLVIALFVALAVLGMHAASRAADPFGRLVAVGVTTWLVVQAFVNIGVVIGLLPVTGVPLPFISFGGSSLLVTLAASGLLLNVARHPAEVELPARRRAGAEVGRARRARQQPAPRGSGRPARVPALRRG